MKEYPIAESISSVKIARLVLAHPEALRFMMKDLLKDAVTDEEIDQFCARYLETLRHYYLTDHVC